jgi:hypothetical protein
MVSEINVVFLAGSNGLRLIIWVFIGFAIYFAYGRYHNVLPARNKNRGSQSKVSQECFRQNPKIRSQTSSVVCSGGMTFQKSALDSSSRR